MITTPLREDRVSEGAAAPALAVAELDGAIDRWVRRAMFALMAGTGAALAALGAVLYG